MAKRASASTETSLELTGFPGAPKDTIAEMVKAVGYLAKEKNGEKRFFFPDGIQYIQLSFNLTGALQGQFSLTLSGAAKTVVAKDVVPADDHD